MTTFTGATNEFTADRACDDVAMLRSVTLSLAMSVLVAACALVELPPLPSGTVTFQVEVRNASRDLVELVVETEAGEPDGSVQPASVAPGSSADVTLSVPIDETWTLSVGGWKRDGDRFGSTIEGWAIEALLDQSCDVVIDLWENNGRNVSCGTRAS